MQTVDVRVAAPPPVDTLVDLVRWRAAQQPTRLAYTFLLDGGEQSVSLSYADLDRRARAIAARLQAEVAPGQRALLLYPPGLDYVAGFFGCLYAGLVAVPAYPPQHSRSLPRLQTIVADAAPACVLTVASVTAKLEQQIAQLPDLARLRWLATDQLDDHAAADWQATDRAGLALLQYTSGSTAAPKGVMVSHANLLHNLAQIHTAFRHSSESRGVIWLPPYHDMGLIGGILQPLYAGFPVTLMSPVSFLQRPLRWLEAITRSRATTSGGPNFAYDLCVRSISAEQRAQLDLSSWQVAFSGAEPVRAATIERFAAAFAECGFRREAFYPCYGLAEATLLVSGADHAAAPTVRWVQAAALSQDRALAVPPDDPTGRALVGCGAALLGQQIVIAEPETRVARPPEQIGEIWVAGPSVAGGYWNRPAETAATFDAHLADSGAGPFLRTGDLGFIHDGALFVTGRLKDLIIIRGRNHYPQDIELTVERSHPALRPNRGVAFAAEIDDQERLVVLHEVERTARHGDLGDVLDAIRAAISAQHELQPAAIVLLKPASLPSTSSGKLQRQASRAAFLAGSFEPIAAWYATSSATDTPSADLSAVPAIEPLISPTALVAWLSAELAQVFGVAVDALDVEQPIVRYGLDSMQAIELLNRIERRTGVSLELATLLEGPTIAQLADAILTEQRAHSAAESALPESSPATEVGPLSYGQRALWFVQQVAPQSTAYTIAQALELRIALDVAALRRALQALLDRHEVLRTVFPALDGAPTAQVIAQTTVCFEQIAADGWDAAMLEQRLAEAVAQPFDLERGPLLRAWLFSRTPHEHVLLLTLHHIITDFWSQALLLHELDVLYAAERRSAHDSERPVLPPLTLRYAEYVRRQERLLEGAAGARLWRYWQQQLAHTSSFLELPTDRPYAMLPIHAQGSPGASHRMMLDAALTVALKQLSADHGVTLYMTLLAAFQVLLYRWSGQQTLLVGSPVAGRSRADLASLAGYAVNPVVLRADLAPDLPFVVFLDQVRQTVLAALAHQDYPFALLVERLQPARDPARPPLVQTLFALQHAPPHAPAALGALALGLPGVAVDLPALPLRTVALAQPSIQFELTLALAEVDGRLAGAWQYNRDLFDPATIERMAQQFETLLAGIVAAPEQPLASLPLLPVAERTRLLHEWNATAATYTHDAGLHQLFEAQATRTPDAVAVVFTDATSAQTLTYGELNERANQLAHYLRAQGVVGYPQAEQVVGVCLERSAEVLIALLGVLKAGAAYLPLDPTYPAERLALMLADSNVAALITKAALVEAMHLPERFGSAPLIVLDRDAPLIAALPAERGPHHTRATLPGQLAYVIYTSGSTGRPKGVCCYHRGVINLVESFARQSPVTPGSRWSWWTSLSFDVSVYEIFAALLAGGTLHIVPDQVRPSGPTLVRWLAQHAIESAFVPAFAVADLAALLRERAAPLPLQRLLVGAEPLDEALLIELDAALPDTRVLNGYGPTETTISPTLYVVTGRAAGQRYAPIGRPIANTEAYLLDAQMQPVPIGVVGEVFLGGDGVARGYLDQPALTAERFVPDPFSGDGARLYRTGDLARYLPDGNLQFIGRADDQIKLRGYRIELGEIETALLRQPGVREAAAIVRDDRLVAYVVEEPRDEEPRTKNQEPRDEEPRTKNQEPGTESREEGTTEQGNKGASEQGNESREVGTESREVGMVVSAASELRARLAQVLPAHMLPNQIVVLDALPLTPSGKTDRRALARLVPALDTSAAGFAPPQSALEQTIAGLWQAALGRERIGIHDNFFELGGHSLLIAQVHSQLQAALGRELPLTALFNYPTVELLARYLSQEPTQPSFQRSIDRAAARKAASRRRRVINSAQRIQGEDDA